MRSRKRAKRLREGYMLARSRKRATCLREGYMADEVYRESRMIHGREHGR